MPKPLPRVPNIEPPFIQRVERLTLVPHSMATIDRLEAKGKFPKRIRLDPTSRVAWLRREVNAYLRQLAKHRQSVARGSGSLPDQSEQSPAELEHQPTSPDHQFAPAVAKAWRRGRQSKGGCGDNQD
jgi:predicted DNA-binding transcriptional regulator AlpA